MDDQIKLYYKNQVELGSSLKRFIDAYFEDKIKDEELETKIAEVISNNKAKFYINETLEVAATIKQILGKNRLDILNKILAKRGLN